MEYYKTYTIEQIEEMANGAARQSEPAIMLRQLLAERKTLLERNEWLETANSRNDTSHRRSNK